ncbi:hypothetical protein [Streptomyces varsoviensis]|uniref:hypothetical protein n=1 Tax=Streptomyces varsoviensis TaxID=67373 RepID=UPI0004C600FB|nr:hypothetical protein [Streptomyces varsoviensis]
MTGRIRGDATGRGTHPRRPGPGAYGREAYGHRARRRETAPGPGAYGREAYGRETYGPGPYGPEASRAGGGGAR